MSVKPRTRPSPPARGGGGIVRAGCPRRGREHLSGLAASWSILTESVLNHRYLIREPGGSARSAGGRTFP